MKMTFHSRLLYILSCLLILSLPIAAQESDDAEKGMMHEREFKVLNASSGLADNSAQCVVATKTGRMIIATLGNINFYDGATFTHIDTRMEYRYQLPLYNGNYHIYFDHMHHLWLKEANAVTCMDLLFETFVPEVEDVFKSMGCEDRVQDMFVDSNGNVWLLTEKGLYSVDNKMTFNVRRDRNLQDLDVVDDMLVTFYDDGEEVGINISNGNIVHRTKAYSWTEGQNYLRSSVIKKDGKHFYQIRNGLTDAVLLHFNMENLKWETLLSTPYHMNSIELADNQLFVATDQGYWRHDLATGNQVHHEQLMLQGGKMLATDCSTLCFDKQGGMWIGTDTRGLLYAPPRSSPFFVYPRNTPKAAEYEKMLEGLNQNISEFNGKQANCMFVDSRNWSWFGTTTGLYLHKDPKETPIVFDDKNGLNNGVIHSIVEDNDHNIWVSTSCGICCIVFEGEKPVLVNNYTQHDKVPNESFINGKAKCLDNGTIVMESLDHMVVFDPKDFAITNGRKPIKLYPKLVRILVNGNFVQPGEEKDGNVIIDRAITRMKDISLNADQNSVSLTFSALNYFRPLQTYYRVRIKGIDEQWKVYSYFSGNGLVDSRGMLHLPLVNILPGEYEIEVQASMFPDIWTDSPYVWIVHVNQPWWRSTGVFIFMFVVVLLLLLVNFIFYVRNTRMRVKRNNEEGDIIRKIRAFVDRCDSYNEEAFAPSREMLAGTDVDANMRLTPEFIKVMLDAIPFVRNNKGDTLTMKRLSNHCGMPLPEFYDTVSSNLFKSPRDLSRIIRLRKGADMLRNTDKSIEEISNECGFYTPNYFIGNFFHEYKMTPNEYRDE